MKKFKLICLFSIVSIRLFGQPPTISWQRCLGGTTWDVANSICQIDNGNYLLIGTTASNDGDVSGNHSVNAADSWVVKLDSLGSTVWQRCYGGSLVEVGYSILQSNDGGFICLSTAESTDGDLTGMNLYGNIDYWVFKCDTLGNILWQKLYGGTEEDIPWQMIRNIEGGYTIVGYTNSNDYDVNGLHDSISTSAHDAWIAIIDSLGNLQSAKCFGGSSEDQGISIAQCPDSGYVLLAKTISYDGDIVGVHSSMGDYWVGKIDKMNNLQWGKCFGGFDTEGGGGIGKIITSLNGGFIFVGNTGSTDGDVIGNHGSSDAWVVKLDSIGNIQWQKCLGGSDSDSGTDISQLADSTYLLLCTTSSIDGDVTNNHSPYNDVWIVNLDQNGNILWQNCYGGYYNDLTGGIWKTHSNNYGFVGNSNSNDGDVSGNHGYADIWVVKLNPLPDGVVENKNPINDFTGQLNSTQEKLTIQFFANDPEKVGLSLLDITGRVIVRKDIETTSGLNKEEIRTGPLSNGIYLVRLETAGGSITKKVASSY